MTRARRARRPQKIVIHRKAGTTVDLGRPELSPLRAVILNLDAAACTGVAVFIDGRLRAHDQVRAADPNARRQVVRECMTAAEVRALPLVMCIEAPWGGFVSAALSLTSTVGLWRDTWLVCGQPLESFVELTAGQWRRGIFGRASMARAAAREWEMTVAKRTAWTDLPHREPRFGADAAAAICMGIVTSKSSGVRKRVGCDLMRPLTAAGKKRTE